MKGEGVCLQAPRVELAMAAAGMMAKTMYPRKQSHGPGRLGGEKVIVVRQQHLRLARACYAPSSDSDAVFESFSGRSSTVGNKRLRAPQRDFWSRVDCGEIRVQEALEEWRKSASPAPGARVDAGLPNFAICTTNLADYSYKSTPFGDVYYSPRFNDNKYTYRFVILTKGVRHEAYRILKSCGRYFLSEAQIIHQLGIDLSPGWEHFMVFRNKLDELILRRPLGS